MLGKYHNPAETLARRRDEILNHNILKYIFFIFAFSLALLFLWLNYWFPFRGSISSSTAVFLALIGICVYKLIKNIKQVKVMNLGITAERDVGTFLQQTIAPLGYRVLNSLSRNNHDIDHVIIGPSGVFAIETKNLQWLARKEVTFDGLRILVDGRALPKKDPIKQAKSAAKEVGEYLKSNNINEFVMPVVLLPRRVVHSVETEGVIVANLKNFQTYIEAAHSKLSKKQVKWFADLISHLS